MLAFFVTWIIFAIVAAVVAGNKGRSGIGWAVLSFFLTPLVILILLALPNLYEVAAQERVAAERAAEKICPQCAERVKAAALVCRFCGHQFPERPPAIDQKPAKGKRVHHARFGLGTVTNIIQDCAVVAFDNGDKHEIPIRYLDLA